MAQKMYSVNIMLSEEDRTNADLMAAKADRNRSTFVRGLIRAAKKHVLEHQPTCASGDACRVPAAVTYPGKSHADAD